MALVFVPRQAENALLQVDVAPAGGVRLTQARTGSENERDPDGPIGLELSEEGLGLAWVWCRASGLYSEENWSGMIAAMSPGNSPRRFATFSVARSPLEDDEQAVDDQHVRLEQACLSQAAEIARLQQRVRDLQQALTSRE